MQGVILGAAVNVANIRLATLGSCLHGIIHCLVKEIFSKTNSYKRKRKVIVLTNVTKGKYKVL